MTGYRPSFRSYRRDAERVCSVLAESAREVVQQPRQEKAWGAVRPTVGGGYPEAGKGYLLCL